MGLLLELRWRKGPPPSAGSLVWWNMTWQSVPLGAVTEEAAQGGVTAESRGEVARASGSAIPPCI